MDKAAKKNEDFFQKEKELDSKGMSNIQKQKYFKSIKDRDVAKGQFVKRISLIGTLEGIDGDF